jgi:hypothetical protein
MTEALRALTVECLRCGMPFEPRKFGHVFCIAVCRHRGERGPDEPAPADLEQVAWLFDESRDPEGRVGGDDWHPNPGTEWVSLDACQTVRVRRHWYAQLLEKGRL